MPFFGIFTFGAPHLSWVMMAFSILLDHSVTIGALRIVVGHVYYFLEYTYLTAIEIQGWGTKKLIEPP